ncbi:OadG family protein [bacterium]|nr:OadG family protein [bacterium]
MMDMALLKEGTIIMAIGLGTVFVFLVVMICAMQINSKILSFIGKYFPEEIPEVKTAKKKVASNKDKIAAAIAAAIHNSRKA